MSKDSLIHEVIMHFRRKHNYDKIQTATAWREMTDAFVDMERNRISADIRGHISSKAGKRRKYEKYISSSGDEAAAYFVMWAIYMASRRSRNIERIIKLLLEYEQTEEIITGKVFRSYQDTEEE